MKISDIPKKFAHISYKFIEASVSKFSQICLPEKLLGNKKKVIWYITYFHNHHKGIIRPALHKTDSYYFCFFWMIYAWLKVVKLNNS